MKSAAALSQFSLEPVRAESAEGLTDAVDIWFDVVSLVEEARTGLFSDLNATLMLPRPSTSSVLFGTMMPTEVRAAPAPPADDPLTSLRGRLILKLEHLKTRVYTGLPDVEAACLYAALVFYIDELVLREPAARAWPLIQQEMFDCTDGGERFFDVVDQRLAVAQTSPVVFEVLFYLLSDHGKHKGFQGRHAGHVEQLAQYHRRLQERILAPELTPRKPPKHRRGQRKKLTQALVERPLPALAYYAAALLGVLLVGLLAVWLSDLPDLGASRTRNTAGDEQEEAAD